MTIRSPEFYTVLDRMAEGAYDSDTTINPELIENDESSLLEMASAALRASGIAHDSVYFDKDFEGVGATSVVRRLHIQHDEQSITSHESYAMRIQPEGFSDEYAPASNLARTIAWNNGVRTPRIHTSDHNTRKQGGHTFTIEDFAEGVNGYDYCNEDTNRIPKVTRELGKLLIRIHQQEVRGFGFYDVTSAEQGKLQGQYDSYRAHVVAGIRRTIMHLLEHQHIDSTQASALDQYYREAPLFDALDNEDPVLLHGDPALYNLRITDSGQPTIVDFGETRGGPKAHDLAVASLDLTRDGWADAANIQADYERAGGELPSYTEEAITAIRLRLLLSVVAGQSRFIQDNPQHTGIQPFYRRAVSALHRDAKSLGIFSSTKS